jgi:tetratricopeptide (TPR) repeat protein
MLALVLIALLSIRQPAEAHAEPTTARSLARDFFERGLVLLEEKQYEAAVAEFRLAYEVSPDYRVLYNIGWVHIALEQPVQAVEAFQRYLDRGGDRIPADRRATVARIIDRERNRLGELEILTNVGGATVRIDGIDAGSTPLEAPLLLTPGRHHVSVRSEQRLPIDLDVQVDAGKTIVMNLELREPALPAGAPAPVPAANAHSSQALAEEPALAREGLPDWLGYGLAATGVGLAGASVGHYLWNRGRYSQWLDRDRALQSAQGTPGYPERQRDNNALAASIERASRVTAGTAIGAGALLGMGVFLVAQRVSASAGSSELRVGLGTIDWRATW